MELGNKKMYLCMLVVCSVLFMSACNSATQTRTIPTEEFMAKLLCTSEEELFEMHSLKVYFYENHFYFDTECTEYSSYDKEWVDYEVVYIYSWNEKYDYSTYEKFIGAHWDDYGSFKYLHDAYLLAVENGECTIYSEEEIKSMVNKYFSTVQN